MTPSAPCAPGLDLVAAVTALGDKMGVELRLRVGILTGQAAVELDAVAEGMVIGDAINTASRIQSVAEPGSVLVDDVTRAVTERAIAYEDAGEHSVKGKSEPVHTSRALRVIAALGGVGRTDLELPLVGRDDEMAVLQRCRRRDDRVPLGPAAGVGHRRAGAGQVAPGVGAEEVRRRTGGHRALAPWTGAELRPGSRIRVAGRDGPARARTSSPEDPPGSHQLKLQALVDDAAGLRGARHARQGRCAP